MTTQKLCLTVIYGDYCGRGLCPGESDRDQKLDFRLQLLGKEVTHEILPRHVLEGDFSYFVLSCSENFSHCISSLPDGSELLLCVCTHTHLHACVCVCKHIGCACTPACTCVCISICMCACAPACLCVYVYEHMCVCAHTCLHVCVSICVSARTCV